MTTLLDDKGKPMTSAPTGCPRCGSQDTEIVRGFGGYWTRYCRKCTTILEEGRDS